MPQTTAARPRSPARAFVMLAALVGGAQVLAPLVAIVTAIAGALGLALVFGRGRDARVPPDDLTGLPARDALETGVAQTLDTSRPPLFAVLVADLDDFHRFNATWGRDAGDALLRSSAGRLASVLRADDLLCRLDADAFAVLIRPAPHLTVDALLAIGDRLLDALGEPVAVGQTHAYASASVGIALSTGFGSGDAARLIAAAERAMLEARAGGAGSLMLYSPVMDGGAGADADLAPDIARAFAAGEIEAWFQPQFTADGLHLTGMEALARWRHPTRGLIPPGAFLATIEALGQSERLSEAMLDQALAALAGWDAAGLAVPRVSVNLGANELRRPSLADRVETILDRHGLAPDRLVLEVLESVAAQPGDGLMLRNLARLRQIGCGLDMDDFGTGHASIAALRQFGVSRIKIARSFVTRLDADADQRAMVRAILTLGRQLGLATLAEGVETEGERAMLEHLGCGEVQGFGLARPMPRAALETWLRHRPTRAAMAAPSRSPPIAAAVPAAHPVV